MITSSIVGIVVSGFTLMITECFRHNPVGELLPAAFVLNTAIIFILMKLFEKLSGSEKAGRVLGSLITFLFSLTNYYIYTFRTSPILPWDIFSVATAASVADNFSYVPSLRAVIVCMMFAVLVFLELVIPASGAGGTKKGRNRGRGSFAAGLRHNYRGNLKAAAKWFVVLVFVAALTFNLKLANLAGLCTTYYDPDGMQLSNGTLLTYIMELKQLVLLKPEGYDRAALTDKLDKMQTITEDKLKPDIIVIMNESLADMRVNCDYDISEDELEFFHQLQNRSDVSSGELYVSILGGNTADSEFEFLTGSSMAFYPPGSIPYQQFVKSKIKGLPELLKDKGYNTEAVHPYYSTGWHRDKVYKSMGFDDMHFIDEFEAPSMLRRYVSDRSCYDKLIDVYENRDRSVPEFIFCVTMQNHGGYGGKFDNFTPELELTGCRESGIECSDAETYLSLVNRSDDAIKDLFRYLEGLTNPVIVLIFGDHQPNDSVSDPILKAATGDTKLSPEAMKERYKVPFIMWSNYDTPVTKGDISSVNYLSAGLLDKAGLGGDSYIQYLKTVQAAYPVVCAKKIVAADGSDKSQEEIAESDILKEYNSMQYMRLYQREGN